MSKDPEYKHFTGKMFTGKNIPEKSTSENEASKAPDPIDWSKIKQEPNIQRPWEDKAESAKDEKKEED